MSEIELFDAPGAEVAEIVTDGDTFKPFVTVIEQVTDEVRMRVTEDGITVAAVDPANVIMVKATLHADGFDSYDVADDTTLGVYVDELRKLVRRARKNSGDELTLSLRRRELTATVARGYDNHNVVSQGELKLLDPDSIRDSPSLPELDYGTTTEVDHAPLMDALSYGVGADKYFNIAAKGINQHTDALYFGGETDDRNEQVAIDGVDVGETGEAKFSVGYINNILEGLSSLDAETVALSFDAEFPVHFDVETDAMSVEYFLAPRIEG